MSPLKNYLLYLYRFNCTESISQQNCIRVFCLIHNTFWSCSRSLLRHMAFDCYLYPRPLTPLTLLAVRLGEVWGALKEELDKRILNEVCQHALKHQELGGREEMSKGGREGRREGGSEGERGRVGGRGRRKVKPPYGLPCYTASDNNPLLPPSSTSPLISFTAVPAGTLFIVPRQGALAGGDGEEQISHTNTHTHARMHARTHTHTHMHTHRTSGQRNVWSTCTEA